MKKGKKIVPRPAQAGARPFVRVQPFRDLLESVWCVSPLARLFILPYPSGKTKELKLLYHTLEKATALLPHGQTQFAIVADCAGFGPSKVHTEMINTAFSTLQEHYPMRLGYVIIVNASAPITFGWKVRHLWFLYRIRETSDAYVQLFSTGYRVSWFFVRRRRLVFLQRVS